ncbi:hypothetical protein GUJ93_ZPchr0005g15306 [Zizania palustris]|uniref:Uncharacterized protein n=1 Tax=Zizania palustris TaxID=103762 RepID=A0A8J5SL89_ZIZPA|nr:hypothetical protein GUJ93_ZPchr0005g15306 [Zizania palustris]
MARRTSHSPFALRRRRLQPPIPPACLDEAEFAVDVGEENGDILRRKFGLLVDARSTLMALIHKVSGGRRGCGLQEVRHEGYRVKGLAPRGAGTRPKRSMDSKSETARARRTLQKSKG